VVRTLSVVILLSAAVLSVSCAYLQRRQALDRYAHGQSLASRQQYQAALAELAKAIKSDPNFYLAYAAAGDIYRRQGDNEHARQSYEDACRANPYAFRPHYNLGVVYQILAETARAADAEGLIRKAMNAYLRATTIQPHDFESNLNLSACYFQLGKYDMAEQYCLAAIEAKPDSPQAYSNLGLIYDSQNRLYDAIKAYLTSLEMDLNQPNLLLNLGSTYMRQGRPKAALKTFEQAVVLAPNDSDCWERMAACLYHLQEFDKALAAYEKAVGLNPQSALARRGIGIVCMSRFVMDPAQSALRDRALAEWHRSLEIDPDQQDLIKLVQKYSPPSPSPPRL